MSTTIFLFLLSSLLARVLMRRPACLTAAQVVSYASMDETLSSSHLVSYRLFSILFPIVLDVSSLLSSMRTIIIIIIIIIVIVIVSF